MNRIRFVVFALLGAAAAARFQCAVAQQSTDDAGAALADLARRNALVAAALELPRETPAQKLSAVARLLDLGQPEAAALVLPDLLQTELNDSQRGALVRQFGVARFMQLIRLDVGDDDQAGVGFTGARDFAQACLDAAADAAADPAAIEQLIASLHSEDPDQRRFAMTDLKTTGLPGASACLSELAKLDDKAARGRILLAMTKLQPDIDGPALAALARGTGQFRRDVAELAGHLKLRGALPWLTALAVGSDDDLIAATARRALTFYGASTPPTTADAELLIHQQIDEALQGALPPSVARSDQWLVWNDAARRLETLDVAREEFDVLTAARVAQALNELGETQSLESRRLGIILAWEEAVLLNREPSPAIAQAVADAPLAELNALLADALAGKHDRAAAKAAAEIGRRKDMGALATWGGQPSPLARALDSPHRSVKFAALSAVMEIDPPASFPGSSRVVDALWYFARSAGEPTAVAASPIGRQAATWAGQMQGLGLDATAVETGRGMLREATSLARSPRLSVVVVDDRIADPPLREAIYQLRINSRTAGAPVVVCCSAERLAKLKSLSDADPLTLLAPRPDTAESLAAYVDRALALSAAPLPPEETRVVQATQAIDWISKLSARGGPYDELTRDVHLLSATVFQAELTEPTLGLLASVGASASQQSLVDYASLPTFSLQTRQAAADAFAKSVANFGVMLTRKQIHRQYDRYNASESADRETQQLLGRILDAIESKDGS